MLASPTGRPIATPAVELWTMKFANTSISTCPAVIATNSRRPRLNGRTMKDTNSIGAMKGIIGQGVPCGTNSEKKCSPWRQKLTTSTIEKGRPASTPVMVKWLVTGSGCTTTSAQATSPGMLKTTINLKAAKKKGKDMTPYG